MICCQTCFGNTHFENIQQEKKCTKNKLFRKEYNCNTNIYLCKLCSYSNKYDNLLVLLNIPSKGHVQTLET